VKSQKLGRNTSDPEVLGVSKNGVWIFVAGKEHFLPFTAYPWFRDAKISQIYNVILVHPRHLRWPDLDVDLHVESLENPAHYPLVYKD